MINASVVHEGIQSSKLRHEFLDCLRSLNGDGSPNCRVSCSAERAKEVALAGVGGPQSSLYNKVKAFRFLNEETSPNWLPSILRLPVLVE
jgi:hypothetical protein